MYIDPGLLNPRLVIELYPCGVAFQPPPPLPFNLTGRECIYVSPFAYNALSCILPLDILTLFGIWCP